MEACLFWSCIDVIVVRVKVSIGIWPFFPMGIESADTNQPPNGEICMDKSQITQLVVPVPIEAVVCTNRGGCLYQ